VRWTLRIAPPGRSRCSVGWSSPTSLLTSTPDSDDCGLPFSSMTTTEQFAERIVGAVDSASLAILLSIGHQTELFDTMAELPPSTSAQIADAAGLNERYVREWLGGRVGPPA